MKFGKIPENLLSRQNGMNHENFRTQKFGAIHAVFLRAYKLATCMIIYTAAVYNLVL